MEKQRIALTDDKFQEIYTNQKFRNEVAFAHGYFNPSTGERYKITCSYPLTYIVTDEQIKKAQHERNRFKEIFHKENKYKLLFVAMGGDFEPRYKDDVCNYRIRTEFLNPEGKKFFIEFSQGRNEGELKVDFSIDRDLQEHYDIQATKTRQGIKIARENRDYKKQTALYKELDKWMSQPYYNYKVLERATGLGKYTTTNILNIVNKNFSCNFKEFVLDGYNLSCDGVICESPKK